MTLVPPIRENMFTDRNNLSTIWIKFFNDFIRELNVVAAATDAEEVEVLSQAVGYIISQIKSLADATSIGETAQRPEVTSKDVDSLIAASPAHPPVVGNSDNTFIFETVKAILAAGNDREIQFNKQGVPGGSSNLTWGSDNKLVITALSSQTADLVNILDASANVLFEITANGHIDNAEGMRTITPQYGAGLGVQLFGENTPEHTNQAGWYDHTGGANEQLFNLTSGDSFTADDAANGNWILFTSGTYFGALCEIKTYIDASTVLVDGLGWDADINSAGSPGTFLTIKHPTFVSGYGFKHEFSVGATGDFEVYSYDFTGRRVGEFKLDAAANAVTNLIVNTYANGYTDTQGLVVNYISGALGAGELGTGIRARVDISEAVAADSTTEVAALTAVKVGETSATTIALNILPGFTYALHVRGAPFIDPDYGYETTSGSSTDRVNGVTADTTAFLSSSASNLSIFDSNGDDILIGSDATFEVIEATLSVTSLKNCTLTFQYSKAGGNWTTLPIKSDGTAGMTRSGIITFAAPGDWTADDEDIDGNAITNAYYIAITRTYAPAIARLPTEAYFKIAESFETGMHIDGQGFMSPRIAADADAPNSSIYYSSTQSKLVYKDSGGSVNDLY